MHPDHHLLAYITVTVAGTAVLLFLLFMWVSFQEKEQRSAALTGQQTPPPAAPVVAGRGLDALSPFAAKAGTPQNILAFEAIPTGMTATNGK